MQRRTFVKNTALTAIALTAYGFVRFDGNKFVGDCETTTDILGPFYRPGSPIRNNLVVAGEAGNPILLNGVILHKDCVTPFKDAKIELWHCSANGVYDNESTEFKYRGTAFSDGDGKYFFNTVLPVPYEVGVGRFRPAHFHMMVSAKGYQPLVTQLYFTGDKYIAGDPSASSVNAKRRILKVQNSGSQNKTVKYNVGMSDKFLVEPSSIDKIVGVYIDKKNKENKSEFFKKDDMLWSKNEVYGESFDFIGDNTFIYPGSTGSEWTLHFEIMANGNVKVTETNIDEKGKKDISVSVKAK